jgi:hypothetical protein
MPSSDPRLTSTSTPLLPNTDDPQREQKWRPLYSRVSPSIATASSGKIAEAWNSAP